MPAAKTAVNRTPPPASGLLERARRVRSDATSLGQSLRDLAEEGESKLSAELEQRPYVTLSLAAGAAYVLGGGVPPRLARWAMGIGTRLFLASLLRDLVNPQRERRKS